jgi:hypothetical protein
MTPVYRRSGMATGRMGAPVAPRRRMQAPKKRGDRNRHQRTTAKSRNFGDGLVGLDSEERLAFLDCLPSLTAQETMRTSPPVAPRSGMTIGCLTSALSRCSQKES